MVVLTLIALYTGEMGKVPPSVTCGDSNGTKAAIRSCVGEDRYRLLVDKQKEDAEVCEATVGSDENDAEMDTVENLLNGNYSERSKCIENSDGYVDFWRETCPCQVRVTKEKCGENTVEYRVVKEGECGVTDE